MYSIIRNFPSVIYMHRGRLYRYEGPRFSADMRSFALKGYENQGEGEEIPPPTTFIGQFRLLGGSLYAELEDAAKGKMGTFGYFVVCMVGMLIGLVISILFMVCYLVFSGPIDPHEDAGAKNKDNSEKVKTN
mmetsp:Transcript_29132/g.38723  ORF Transcript_29132/g.38723 Transcript_29132/m.38723 type:complete len:132 (-) Transcript_29132:621-1016(-)